MSTYQELIMHANAAHMDPSTLISPHENLSLLFPDITSIHPDTLDHWLADELCKSGVISNSLDFLQNESKQQEIMTMLSPPFTPLSSNMSDSGSSQSSLPPRSMNLPLFPDILASSSQSSKTKATNKLSSLPKLAPKPSNFSETPSVLNYTPIPPSPKRKSGTSNDTEELVLKRQKNTDAARRSRLKKLVKMEALENKVNELENENRDLHTRIAVLESEKAGIEAKDITLEERIRVLEAQLAEAHRVLTKF